MRRYLPSRVFLSASLPSLTFTVLLAAAPTIPPLAGVAFAASAKQMNVVVRAAAEPDGRRLRALLDSGATVNAKTALDESPLQVAAANGCADNVALLLARGADIDAPAARGATALGWAARNGHTDVVRQLLDAGAKPDAAAGTQRTPIVLAIARGHIGIIRLLVERGTKVYQFESLAGAALQAVADIGNLVQSGKIDENGIPGNPELLRLVLPPMADLLSSSGTLAEAAAEVIAQSPPPLDHDLLRYLGAPVAAPAFQSMLLLKAARRGRPDLVTAAIRRGADVNASYPKLGTPLAAAVAAHHLSIVGILVSANADPALAGVDEAVLDEMIGPLMADRRAIARLEREHALDRLDEHGETVLFRAVSRGDVFLVATLLAKQANPSVTVRRWPGDEGWTPLMVAAAAGSEDIVRQLLAASAAVDQRNARGRTALSFAAWYGRSLVVRALLAAGADPQASDLVGQTPLQLGIASGDGATIAVLSRSIPARPNIPKQAAAPSPAGAEAAPIPPGEGPADAGRSDVATDDQGSAG